MNERFGPDGAKNAFYLAQIAIGSIFVIALWRMKPKGVAEKSGFSVRESDVRKKQTRSASNQDLAQAKIERKVPLALEGIRIGGPPHEVLGVRVGASEAEIQKAYRERMKQYHPDKVGRPGSREWNDAQQIAEAINLAKNELLKRARRPG